MVMMVMTMMMLLMMIMMMISCIVCYVQNPVDAFRRSFPADWEVANLLPTNCYELVSDMASELS